MDFDLMITSFPKLLGATVDTQGRRDLNGLHPNYTKIMRMNCKIIYSVLKEYWIIQIWKLVFFTTLKR